MRTDMSRSERHEAAVNVFHRAFKAYGAHPTRRQERYINNELCQWLTDDATPAQITEALAAAHDMQNLTGKTLAYHGQDTEPGDQLYPDALLEHQTTQEDTIYAIVREIDQ